MLKINLKLGFLAVIILEIAFTFYLLRIYHHFVSNPENYYRQILQKNTSFQDI